MLIFAEGGKTGEPGEKPSWHGREQHIKQTQFTYGPSWESNPGHSGERPVLSPLGQPCHPFTTKLLKSLSFQKDVLWKS